MEDDSNVKNGIIYFSLTKTLYSHDVEPKAVEEVVRLAVCSPNKHRLTEANSLSLWNALKDRQNIGLLQVTIHSAHNLRATDIIKLSSQSDPYCFIELGNTRFRTRSGFKKNRNLYYDVNIESCKLKP